MGGITSIIISLYLYELLVKGINVLHSNIVLVRFSFKIFGAVAFLAFSGLVSKSQTTNVVIANGGAFEPVAPYSDRATIGVYNAESEQYWVFDTIQVESVQDLIVDGNFAYLAAQDSIIKYDLTTYKQVGAINFPGLKSLTISGNMLFVGRWFGSGSFLEVYDKSDLSLMFDVPQIYNAVYGVAVIGDTAYVPYNDTGTVDLFPGLGIYEDTLGRIGVVDLVNQVHVRDILLDTIGAETRKIYAYDSSVYVVCEKNKVLVEYDVAHDTLLVNDINVTKGTALVDSILFANYGGGIGSYDILNKSYVDSSILTGFYAASAIDTLGNEIYVTTTDYTSVGNTDVYNMSGTLERSFSVNVSPEAMAVDIKTGNYSPIALDDFIETQESVRVNVLANDYDPNGDALTVTILSGSNNGISVVVGDSVDYVANSNFIGVDSIKYQICDPSQGCDSAWAIINVSGTVGDIRVKNLPSFGVYPNPTQDLIKLNVSPNDFVKYQIYDVRGRRVQKGVVKESVIDLRYLNQGTYFIKVVNGSSVYFDKVVRH